MLNDPEMLRRQKPLVDALIDELQALRNTPSWNATDALRALKATAAISALLAANGLGECRILTPYSPLQPILDSNGLRWCCSHQPQHCS